MRAPGLVVVLQAVVPAAVKIDYSLELQLQLQAVHFRLYIQLAFDSAELAAEQPFAARLRF